MRQHKMQQCDSDRNGTTAPAGQRAVLQQRTLHFRCACRNGNELPAALPSFRIRARTRPISAPRLGLTSAPRRGPHPHRDSAHIRAGTQVRSTRRCAPCCIGSAHTPPTGHRRCARAHGLGIRACRPCVRAFPAALARDFRADAAGMPRGLWPCCVATVGERCGRVAARRTKRGARCRRPLPVAR